MHANRILASNSAAEATLIGGAVNGDFNTQDAWDCVVYKETMLRALQQKFLPGEDLASELAGTCQCQLAMASQADLVWGIGCSVLEAELWMVWVGQNLLGESLQEVRQGLGRRRACKRKKEVEAPAGPTCASSPRCPIAERPSEGVEYEGCEMDFGYFSVALEHEKHCPEYAVFLAGAALQVDAAVDAVGGAATAGAAAEAGLWSHMVKPSGKTPSIPDGGAPVVAQSLRISAKGGAAVGKTRRREPKKAKKSKSSMHAKSSDIDLKEGDTVQMPWDTAVVKRAKKDYDATLVEIDWDRGQQPMQVKFGGREIAWVGASCVKKSSEGNNETLALGAARIYQNSQHDKTDEAAVGPEAPQHEPFYSPRSGGVELEKCVVCGLRGRIHASRYTHAGDTPLPTCLSAHLFAWLFAKKNLAGAPVRCSPGCLPSGIVFAQLFARS